MPVEAWLALGFAPADGRPISRQDRAEPASLLLPEGIYGPAFLTPKNYFVLKEYNFADLYVLFVGNLSDRIAGITGGFATPWANISPPRSRDIEAMQRSLAARGYYADKIDGKAGMKTRGAIGAYQKANALKVDCWPSPEVFSHIGRRERPR
jgi:hypothetical protein